MRAEKKPLAALPSSLCRMLGRREEGFDPTLWAPLQIFSLATLRLLNSKVPAQAGKQIQLIQFLV
jgi:hypothetical protein